MPIDPSPLSAAPRDRLDDGFESSSLLGSPPSLPVGAAAMRARQVIKASLFPEQPALAPQIGRFVVLRELGRGGMGVVYVAYDETLDRRVALKLLYELPGDDEDGQARLLREAQTMARLNHPNVAAVYEAGTHEGRVYVAMEFVQGQPLDVWLREKQRPWREVIDVFIQAGRGLRAAHCAGLVHRDFKPANVMLGRDGRVRVLDFGLARGTRALAPDTTLGSLATMSVTLPVMPPGKSLTREGTIVGTPAYMPPEQFHGQPIDPRADQYALCVSMYEGLYGRLPFHGKTLTELWAAVLDGPPKAPPRGPRVPGWLHRLVLRGLDPDAARRFPSMDALLAALEQRPGRRMRAWLLAGLGVAVVAGGLYGNAYVREARCTFGEEDLAGLWDAERKDELRVLFTSQALPVRAAWDAAEQQIDAITARWMTDRGTACATHRDGKEPFPVYERRQHCLAQYKLALTGTLTAIRTSPPRSPSAVETIIKRFEEGQRDCISESSDEWKTMPPPQHQTEVIDRLFTEYYAIVARQDDPFEPTRLEASQGLVSEAERLGYGPLRVHTVWLRGILENHAGLSREYCSSLFESFYLADATGLDTAAAHIATHVLDACRDHGMRDPSTASTWAHLALAKVERAGSDNGVLRIMVLARISTYMLELGHLDDAGRYILDGLLLAHHALEEPERRAQSEPFARHLIVAASRFLDNPAQESLRQQVRAAMTGVVQAVDGDKSGSEAVLGRYMLEMYNLVQSGRLADAQEIITVGLAALEARDSSDQPSKTAMLAMLAEVLRLRERCHEGLLVVQQCLRDLDVLPTNRKDIRALVWMAAMGLHTSCGDMNEAKKILSSFTSIYPADTKPDLNFVQMELSYEIEANGDARAVHLADALMAQSKATRFRDPRIDVFSAIEHAKASIKAGKLDKAKRSAQRAIVDGEAIWGPTHIFLASPLTVLGKAELADGNYDIAVAYLERALALRTDSDPQFRADTRFALARALAKMVGDERRARLLGEQALAEYAAAGPRRAREHGEVTAWLASL